MDLSKVLYICDMVVGLALLRGLLTLFLILLPAFVSCFFPSGLPYQTLCLVLLYLVVLCSVMSWEESTGVAEERGEFGEERRQGMKGSERRYRESCSGVWMYCGREK